MFNKIPQSNPTLKHTFLPTGEVKANELKSPVLQEGAKPLAKAEPQSPIIQKSLFSRSAAHQHKLQITPEENLDAELDDSNDIGFSINAELALNNPAPLVGLDWMGDKEFTETSTSEGPIVDLSNMPQQLKLFPEIENLKEKHPESLEHIAIEVAENEGFIPRENFE